MVTKLKVKKENSGNTEKLNAQQFFEVVMKASREFVKSELIEVKRDIADIKIMQKLLRKKMTDLELDFKALGIAIGQLGVVEINMLNNTKNKMRDKLSVVSVDGQIYGRTDIRRFNIIPKDKNIPLELQNI